MCRRVSREKLTAMIKSSRVQATLLTYCLISFAMSLPCSGQEFFPGNIFELRPPHVRLSEPNESPAKPHGGRWFGYFEAPPAITPQSEVRLTEADLLSLVYPASGGSYYSGGSSLFDRLRVDGSQLELDVFRFFSLFGPIGNALVPPRENSLFIGQLRAGEYTVNIRNWYLPPDALSGFDPEAFVPPSNASMPPGQIFATPVNSGDPPVFLESSFPFVVQAVPEIPTLVLAFIACLVSMVCGRHRIH
jgi:hypothetical protein